jgi:AcrR family transcriptional regulator
LGVSNPPLDPPRRLLDAAGRVFAERGYRAATVREICERAGANIAAVNYYFGGKERLYIEAVKRAFRERIEQVPLPEWPPGATVSEKLNGFIRTFVTRVVADPGAQWHRKLLMRELAEPTAACMEFVRDLARPQFHVLLKILEEILPPRTRERKRHLVALSIIGQCVYHALAKPVIALLVGDEEYKTYDAHCLAEHIGGFSLAALGLASAGRRSPGRRRGNTSRTRRSSAEDGRSHSGRPKTGKKRAQARSRT